MTEPAKRLALQPDRSLKTEREHARQVAAFERSAGPVWASNEARLGGTKECGDE